MLTVLAFLLALTNGSAEAITFVAAAPALLGIKLGAWVVTMIVLPATALMLRNRPMTLYAASPAAGCLAGAAVIAIGAMLDGSTVASAPVRFIIAGAMSGLAVGAIFGTGMYRCLR